MLLQSMMDYWVWICFQVQPSGYFICSNKQIISILLKCLISDRKQNLEQFSVKNPTYKNAANFQISFVPKNTLNSKTHSYLYIIHKYNHTKESTRQKASKKMMFEQEQPNNQQNYNAEIAKTLKDEQISSYGGNNIQTIKFSSIVSLFNKMSTLRSRKKSDYLKTFLKLLFRNNRSPEFTYSVLRLLLPAQDRERGNYGVKEKNLAIIIRDCFNLTKEQYERLKHFKNPNYHQGGVGIGDFAICLYDVVKGVCNRTSTLTVKKLNQLLDDMVKKDTNEQKQPIFRELYRISNAEQIKWIARIILKDLKLSIKIDYVLNTFHPDGNDYYNLTNSIKQTCIKLQSLQTSLNDDIALFHPIRPMLAGKRNMRYFQQTSQQKQYFVQTKFDGERLQCHIDKDQIKFFSRNGVDYNHVYYNMIPLIKDSVTCDSCILDGEIIVLEKDTFKPMPFGLNKLVASGQEADMQLCYKVFDILWVKKEDEDINLMGYALRERKRLLDKVIVEKKGKLEVVKYKTLSRFEDIEKQFKQSIQRNEEGLMLKDPQSPYVPKERAMNWMKMKGDYVQGLTDTLDLIILGGYFGNLSYRVGPGGHWSDKITTFLMGVIEKIDPQNPKVAYAVPFCKVGTGYTGVQLQQLRAPLRKNLILNDGNLKPSYLTGNWKPKLQDRPDCYINSLCNSRILEVKGAELINSQAFGAPVTLRFPRVVAIRYDKDWNEALKLQQLTNMQNNDKYTKNIRRKRAGSQSDGQQKPHEQDKIKKKTKLQKLKKNNQIMQQFRCVSLQQQKVKSHLFTDMQFFVFQFEGSPYTKHDIQKMILINNGKVVQNPMITTEFVVADRIDFKLRLLEKYQQKSFTFIKPQYVINCVETESLLPLSPIYLTVLPLDKQQYYRQNFDRFGDSYTTYLNRRELDQILKQMDKSTIEYPVDKRLEQKISLKRKRTGKISLCFGVADLQTLQLRALGNLFVDSFCDELNSIIVGRNVSDAVIRKINGFVTAHRNVVVETVQTLYENTILA